MPPLDQVVSVRGGRIGWKPYILDSEEYGLHEHTVEQEFKTICNRHLFATPEPDLTSAEWGKFRLYMGRLARAIGRVEETPIRTLLEGRSGRRRKRFYEGAMRYLRYGVEYSDSTITEMQKLEFYEESKIEVKEDRGIQFRSVSYNVALARHLHEIEARLIGLHEMRTGRKNVLGYRPVAKGSTPRQRCEMLFDYADVFDEPVFLCMDHSRFDAHVNAQLLREEHRLYLYCRRWHPELAQLLRWQTRNQGRSKGGIRYKMKAKRMSGDINTGLGNTVLNLCMILGWLDFAGISKHRIILDGDDSVVIVERADYVRQAAGSIEAFMLKLGMETEVEVKTDIWKVDFCQSRPVILPTADGPRPVFVRNPMKVVTTMGRTAERRDDVTLQMVMRSSALSELAIAPGAPVTNALAKRVLNYFGDGKILKTPKQLYKEEAYGFDCRSVDVSSVPEPDLLARHTFWRAWDIPPSYQEYMEGTDIDWQIPRLREGRKRPVKPDFEEPIPSEIWDLGQVPRVCGCGDCPVYTGQGCMRWV